MSLEEALAGLAKYAMVKWMDATNASVQVHRLVRRSHVGDWQRGAAILARTGSAAGGCPVSLSRHLTTYDPGPCGRLRPHVAAVATQADQVIAAPTARC